MLLFLFLFNDPVFMIHIYNPTIFTFFISELFTSCFICALMIFWLVEATKGGRIESKIDDVKDEENTETCSTRVAR